ncbi:MAG: c-type cytochrome, partial [Planctomycetia bacterium]|nr:c-type cytochrome [Planctomycetia bacterium]
PVDAFTPAERVRDFSDPLNPPGTERKVGPSLRRISEKTNYDWLVKWIRSPRDYRPDTKMPHFYGLSNNHPDVLPPDQKDFPATEIHAAAAYLIRESDSYLKGSDKFRLAQEARQKDLQQFVKDGTVSEAQQRELAEVSRKLELHAKPQPLADLPAKLNDKPTPEQLYRGRELFSERGCLACHQHEGTQQTLKGPDKLPTLPAITGEALFGPNLSRLAGKLGVKPGDQVSARKWLVRWIMDPSQHHPRTKMPVTQLTLEEANDVASWLLAQPVKDYTPPEVPAPDLRMLKELARVHLIRSFTRLQVDEILEKGLPSQWFVDNKKSLDSDERELETAPGEAKSLETKLKMYVGKKAIGQLGCYACHDIPGFENAKPIGTPLNDWGKKDAERLAFEDAVSWVTRNFAVVPRLVDDKGKPVQITKKGADGNPLPPYEKFFFDLLEHHQREGFLHQKLLEPRSYDYDRIRAWDDRLRMPQFKFARTERNADESEEDYNARRNLEEAHAREDVMTFILGLVAEPIPPKFVHNPAPEKLAEVKGRKILDKYNCNGCHLIRPGVFEFSPLAPAPKEFLEGEPAKAIALDQLNRAWSDNQRNSAGDHVFLDSNAWVGVPPRRPDRLTAFGLPQAVPNPDDESKPFQAVQLTQALRYHAMEDGKTLTRDIPAYNQVILPFARDMAVPASSPYGGTFGNLLAKYLTEKDRQKFDKEDKARPAVPPALLRQGEKTQPLWLFNFLRQPHEIRPVTVLRMPRFNMSEDEAMALVNYFSAVDKLENPAGGLTYPYLTIREREDSYLEQMTAAYVERLKKDKVFDKRVDALKPLWESSFNATKAQLTAAEAKLKEAEEQVSKLQEDEKKEEDKDKKKQLEDMRKKTEEARDLIKKEVERLKAEAAQNDPAQQQQRWATREAWLLDGFKPLVSEGANAVCINCHQIGSVLPKEKQGPNLDLTWHRLRPEWTKLWLANPQRFMTYTTPMPQNFPRNASQFQDLIRGPSLEQLTGVRDALINYPKVIDMPANRSRPVTVVGGGN